jgi:signal peptidase I
VFIAIILRWLVVGSYEVNGDSMEPNFHNGDRLIVDKLSYKVGQIKRGDVIVFHATPTDDYIKRVIGLPNDKIEYKHDQLYVNGKKVNEPYLSDYKHKYHSLTEDFTLKQLTKVSRVPKGKLWVMGDNRRNSTDSRYLGFIDEDKVVGKVELRYYPFNDIALFTNPFKVQ